MSASNVECCVLRKTHAARKGCNSAVFKTKNETEYICVNASQACCVFDQEYAAYPLEEGTNQGFLSSMASVTEWTTNLVAGDTKENDEGLVLLLLSAVCYPPRDAFWSCCT